MDILFFFYLWYKNVWQNFWLELKLILCDRKKNRVIFKVIWLIINDLDEILIKKSNFNKMFIRCMYFLENWKKIIVKISNEIKISRFL